MGSLSLDDSLFRNQELPSLSSALAYKWYSVGSTWCILIRGSWQPLSLSLHLMEMLTFAGGPVVKQAGEKHCGVLVQGSAQVRKLK